MNVPKGGDNVTLWKMLLPKGPHAPPHAMVPLTMRRGPRGVVHFTAHEDARESAFGIGALVHLEGATAPNSHGKDHDSWSSPRLVEVHVTPGQDEKKELVRDVHRLARLGVQLVDSTKGGFMIHHSCESSFVVDVQSKQHLNPIFMELKELVLNKSIKIFSQGGDGVLRYQGRLCVPNVDGLKE
ncbi:hypothetical protein MTR67_051903 [Solanum verrucosum]|uniref:Uncharacterized protein n=1 Tax=Solanum verrucosum TaxID=315347 RepID=A0AAF1A2I1_SOLVR|nr:hypothetical protein MTR67_051903 [Solanum verrucosum]